jgi:hypothetical protein
MPWFDHMSDFEPIGHSFEAMVDDFCPFEQFFQFKMQSIAVKGAIF